MPDDPIAAVANAVARAQESASFEGSGENVVLTVRSTSIRTLDDALAEAKVDTRIWEVDRWTCNKWDQGQRSQACAIVVELWQVKVWLKRIAPQAVTDCIERFFSELPRQKIALRKAKVSKDADCMLVLALFDAHFGKLAWRAETGEDYDINIARKVYIDAIEDLLERVKPFKASRIVLPVGQDFFHVDNWLGTTAKGTIQDTDSRFAKVFDLGLRTVVEAVGKCACVAPVEVLYSPGNHDLSTSWYLVKVLEAQYAGADMVIVDPSPKARKYVRHGKTLVGFTHGDEEKHSSLPTIMATECAADWAESECRIWMVGHKHTRREDVYHAGDTFNGVRVVTIPSLSGTDAWHYKKGYVKTEQAAEGWLFGLDDGYVGHLSVNVREAKP